MTQRPPITESSESKVNLSSEKEEVRINIDWDQQNGNMTDWHRTALCDETTVAPVLSVVVHLIP